DGQLVLQNRANNRIALLTITGTNVVSSQPISPNLSSDWRVAASADFDLDGQRDLVVQSTITREITILYMDGSVIRAFASLRPVVLPNYEVVAAGDFNGDGKP